MIDALLILCCNRPEGPHRVVVDDTARGPVTGGRDGVPSTFSHVVFYRPNLNAFDRWKLGGCGSLGVCGKRGKKNNNNNKKRKPAQDLHDPSMSCSSPT